MWPVKRKGVTTLGVQPSAAGVPPGRVRSRQARTGLKGVAASGLAAVLGASPAAAHWPGLVKPATGLPAVSRQGELSSGSAMPRVKASLRKVCW